MPNKNLLKPRTLIFVWLVLLAWLGLLALILIILLNLFFKYAGLADKYFMYLIYFTVGLGVTAILVGESVKCKSCRNSLFKEKRGGINKNAYKIRGLNYWASSVVGTVFNRRVTCISCGMKYKLKDLE